MTKLKTALSAPSIAGFLTGAATAGILYVANHVLHIPLLESQVETIVTPFAAAAATALVQRAKRPAQAVQAEAAKVEANPLISYLTQEIAAQLSASPTLGSKLVSVALSELTSATPAQQSPVSSALAALAAAPVTSTVKVDGRAVAEAVTPPPAPPAAPAPVPAPPAPAAPAVAPAIPTQ